MENDPLTDAFDIYIEYAPDKGEMTENHIAECHDTYYFELDFLIHLQVKFRHDLTYTVGFLRPMRLVPRNRRK